MCVFFSFVLYISSPILFLRWLYQLALFFIQGFCCCCCCVVIWARSRLKDGEFVVYFFDFSPLLISSSDAHCLRQEVEMLLILHTPNHNQKSSEERRRKTIGKKSKKNERKINTYWNVCFEVMFIDETQYRHSSATGHVCVCT